jgi:hypothetical protein
MKYLKVNEDGTITLPKDTLKNFPALTELVLWWQGDSLVLKKVSPFRSSEFAERLPAKGPGLSEISKEVQKMRKEKRRG